MCQDVGPFPRQCGYISSDVLPTRSVVRCTGYCICTVHARFFWPFVSGVQGSKYSHTGDERAQHLGTSLSVRESWTSCCLAGVFPALKGSEPELALVPLSNKQILLMLTFRSYFKRWKQWAVRADCDARRRPLPLELSLN